MPQDRDSFSGDLPVTIGGVFEGGPSPKQTSVPEVTLRKATSGIQRQSLRWPSEKLPQGQMSFWGGEGARTDRSPGQLWFPENRLQQFVPGLRPQASGLRPHIFRPQA